MKEPKIYEDGNCSEILSEVLNEVSAKNILLVCSHSFDSLIIKKDIELLAGKYSFFRFGDFAPNPVYESVQKGVKFFKESNCDTVLAIGGGSAIDVAKCIKLFSHMEDNSNYLEHNFKDNGVPIVCIPTTAGTGSEATRYAVIYYNGEKQSITHESIIPDYALLIPDLLGTLPLYQKKATMLDALCHSIESFWSVNSTDESKKYSSQAIRMIIDNKNSYLSNNIDGNKKMLIAANLAGKAINITQTTAGHAMCYKITSLYNIAHGHAAGCCVPYLWEFMLDNMGFVTDYRGKEYLLNVFYEISECLGCDGPTNAVAFLKKMLFELSLEIPKMKNDKELELLIKSVNPTRLKNNPIALNKEQIKQIYTNIFGL